MNENGRRILEMLSEGKISVDEAERLLSLVDQPNQPNHSRPLDTDSLPRRRDGPGKYLRIVGVDGDERFNIRVPLSLIRGGVKLGGLFATGPGSKVDEELKKRGIDLDRLGDSSGLDDLVEGLGDLDLDFEDSRQRVVIYAE